MVDLTEMNKLERYLKEKGIQYQRVDEDLGNLEIHRICVPGVTSWRWDAICHQYSHGWEDGLIEIMGDIVPSWAGDCIEGRLTADEVIERIEERGI